MTETLFQTYMSLVTKYQETYGRKTFVLYQVGSFFEVYSSTKNTDYMLEFASMCELKIAHKPVHDHYMAGFRDYVLDKYIEKIVSQSEYTVVVYVQKAVGGVISRVKDSVYSSGTFFNTEDNKLSNNISCLWIHKTSKKFNETYIFGITTVDIYTGHVTTNETTVPYYHNPTSYDTIEKHMSVYRPNELIVVHTLDEQHIESILKYINCGSNKVTRISLSENTPLSLQAKKCDNQCFQEDILNKYYPNLKNETLKSNLFENPISFNSLCFLLNYVGQHNADLIKKISEPVIECTHNNLILANHSLKQLNIINNNQTNNSSTSSVLNLLNKCKTKMGQRSFRSLMTNPMKDVDKLNASYDLIEHMIANKYTFTKELSNIQDLDKIYRKIVLKTVTPVDYYNLYYGCDMLQNMLDFKDNDYLSEYLHQSSIQEKVQTIKNNIMNFFSLDVLHEINTLQFDKFPEIICDLIKPNNNEQLDQTVESIVDSKNKLTSIIAYLNQQYALADKKCKTDVIKLCESPIRSYLTITKRRGQILKEHIKSKVTLEFVSTYSGKTKTFEFDGTAIEYGVHNPSTSILQGPDIDGVLHQMSSDNTSFYKCVRDVYNTFTLDLDDLHDIIECITNIDVLNTKKDIAVSYNYSKPKIELSDKSFLDATKLRHPLIEHIDKNELYVTNDVRIGKGILLFGTNAVGKTSLIKSVGICVIMAQCGLYVPCESFTYSPYEYIFTRIIGNDNIFHGLSTFAVEMSELRVILKYCNKNSLILGDELCSGTEIDSALSIFVTSLEALERANSSFIFATHFHQIQYFDEIKQMKNVSLNHLAVTYNHELKTLVYDRTLRDGAGESIYGLEVCKSLDLPDEFLTRAYEVRNKYDTRSDNILEQNTTKYNKDKVKGKCEFCNEDMGTEIHHMRYQKDLDKNDIRLNHKANLSSICDKCHDNIHKLGLVYERRKTTNGYKIVLIKN
jgi:DNA mismatch repair protein MutS